MERSSGAAPPRRPGGSGEAATITEDQLVVGIEPAGDGASILSLAGELDLNTVPRLEQPLLRELGSKADVILDLTRVTFIDSSGIGLLVKAVRGREGKEVGRLHTVVAGGSQVDRVFDLAGIHCALPLYGTRDAAFEAVSSQGG